MSSAILYLAIVAIWACVLIPRWLKRDVARGGPTVSWANTAPDGVGAPGSAAGSADADPDGGDGLGDGATNTALPGESDDAPRPLPAPPPSPLAAPLGAEESRRRMLAARRRLLGMLSILEVAAITLAFLHLAAMWVVVPPTLMLTGYLLLLREAAHADAEHAKRGAEAAVRVHAMARSRRAGTGRAAQHPTPVEGTPLAAAAAAADLAAKFAAAPVPADYEDSGRDFAPGLAGKYTTSNANSGFPDEDYGYEEPRLRAVGD
jgi:hypothetical protein